MLNGSALDNALPGITFSSFLAGDREGVKSWALVSAILVPGTPRWIDRSHAARVLCVLPISLAPPICATVAATVNLLMARMLAPVSALV